MILGAVPFAKLPDPEDTARKVLEEASEVREAWSVARAEGPCAIERFVWLDECADLCQALVNLMASMGVTEEEFAQAAGRCIEKNERRGRTYPEEGRREAHVRCPRDMWGRTIRIGSSVTDGEKTFTVEAVGPEAVFGRAEEPAYAELYRSPAELEVCEPVRALWELLTDCDGLDDPSAARRLINEAYFVGLEDGRNEGR